MSTSLLITVANHGWRNRRVIEVSSASCGWEVGKARTLSVSLPASDAHRLGFSELKGLWVRMDFGGLGPWGGIIRRNPTETLSGTMELSCDSFHMLLKHIRTPRTYRQASAPAGALWMRALADCATDRRLWLDSYAADEDGPLLTTEWRGDDLYDLTDYLATNSNHEWDVTLNDDWSITGEFRRTIGRRKQSLLADGYNVAVGGVSPSSETIVNDIIAVSDDQQWETAPGVIVTDADSLAMPWGRQAETRRYAGVTGVDSLYVRAKQDLARDASPAIPATVVIAATDMAAYDIRQGDTVPYWSARQNAQYDFRVRSRAFSTEDGQLQLGGECVAA